jgi:hypothetical protein
MNNKKSLLKLFTKDVSYNYHIVKTTEPKGHLIYLIKSGSELNTDSLEFTTTLIAEELINECEIKIEKIAPAIFFTETKNSKELKYKLNNKLSEDKKFSKFIKTIKDEYRILEVKDSLLYKKDPEAYKKAKEEERAEHQNELMGKMLEQIEEEKKQREEYLLSYNNDLIKLLKDYLDSVIEFEKQDLILNKEIKKVIYNLIDIETWIKIDEKPLVCDINICSFEKDKLNVFLNNNVERYTATLKFEGISIKTENVIKINIGESNPIIMTDYDFLAKMYDIDLAIVNDWEFKNETDRISYVIDYLTPILKIEKERKEEEFLKKIKEEEEKEEKNIK